jgi:hypothetical protein
MEERIAAEIGGACMNAVALAPLPYARTHRRAALAFVAALDGAAAMARERGKIGFLPHLLFEFRAGEQRSLDPRVSDGKAKNIPDYH